jgi:hypothetical protein
MESPPQSHTTEMATIPFAEFPAYIINRSLERKTTAYCIIDSAQDEEIFPMLKNCEWEYTCLYKKNLHFEGDRMVEELAATAPYLLKLDPTGMNVESFVKERLGKKQIIVLESAAPMQEIADHFSSLLKAMDEDGKVINFRYYDPKILRVYLPTCTDEETYIFFGDIDTIWVEGEDEEILEFEKDWKEKIVEQETEEPVSEQKEDDAISEITEPEKKPEKEPEEGFGVMGDFF